MADVDEWLNDPLSIVQNIFAEDRHSNWSQKITDYFNAKITDDSSFTKIPSINCCDLHNLRPNSLARFRGTIQDMFDPEFYMDVYQVKNRATQEVADRCGRYRDLVDSGPAAEVCFDSPNNVTNDRLTFYCKAVGEENEWVREAYASKCPRTVCTSASASTSGVQLQAKRVHTDDDDDGGCGGGDAVSGNSKETWTRQDDMSMETETTTNAKKQRKTAAENGATASNPGSALPNLNEKACLVKLYDREHSFLLNDIVEFVGILSVDPSLAYVAETGEGAQSAFLNNEEEMELEAAAPPPSLVPRLHVLFSFKLKHNNPLLPPLASSSKDLRDVVSRAATVRPHLHALLELATFGDALAADYLICHLISSVYLRKDVTVLGKFSVNLSNIPVGVDYSEQLYSLIKTLTTQSCYLPLTLTNLNTLTFVPKKDYKTNRLTTGLLQLSPHTHLVLDEASLTQGQLDASGVRNLSALGYLITWQKVEYDFSFHRMEYAANAPVLILSEGKSLLPSECQVCLQPSLPLDTKAQFQAIHTYLTPALVDEIRRYISALKLTEFQMSEDLQKAVQEDFVAARREDKANMTAEDLHLLLLLTRLLSLSEGSTSLTRDAWEKAKCMETERKSRLRV